MKKLKSIKIILLWVIFTSLTCGALGQKIERLFYITDNEENFQDFKRNLKKIDIISPAQYKMNEIGTVWGNIDSRLISIAKKNNIKVMPLIVNPGFDQPMFHKFLLDSSAQKKAIKSMLEICKANDYYGIQFDFENVYVADKDLLTRFYKNTADVLHKNGYAISIAVVVRTSDFAGPSEYHRWIFEYWRGAYDYKELANAGDFISFMTYDQHTRRTPPGPVAGYTWMEDVINYILKDIPPEKISLGIPFYSDYWYADYQNEKANVWGAQIPYARAKGLLERNNAELLWNEKDKVHYTFYPNSGLYEYIYFEDSDSFKAKMVLLKKYKLRGFSVWSIGSEDPSVWDLIP